MTTRASLGRSPKLHLEDLRENEITPISEKELELLNPIGSGSFGQVYTARWKKRNNMLVAVKYVNADKKKEFEAELQSLTSVSHPNIVKLYGASIAPPRFHMVMELCAGSLQFYIRKHTYEYTDVHKWALQTAEAMAYLHGKNIIHRDLKTGNILLDSSNNVKICDFGAARSVEASLLMTFIGTLGYMAPEMLREQKTSNKVDLYSYGVVVWETLTKKAPFADMQPIQVIWLVGASGQRLPIPEDCPKLFSDIINATWRDDPKERPSFADVVAQLKDGAATLTQGIVGDGAAAPKSLASSQQAWGATIDKTIEGFKGVEKTVQAKMNELKAKEDALKQRENEMKLRGEQAAKQQAALAAAASSAAIIDEDDDDNVTATLRRIKSLPLQRKQPRSSSSSQRLQLIAHAKGEEPGSPYSPSSALGSYTPTDTPLTTESALFSPLKGRQTTPPPDLVVEAAPAGLSDVGATRTHSRQPSTSSDHAVMSPRSMATPTDSGTPNLASPVPMSADEDVGDATVKGPHPGMAAVAAAMAAAASKAAEPSTPGAAPAATEPALAAAVAAAGSSPGGAAASEGVGSPQPAPTAAPAAADAAVRDSAIGSADDAPPNVVVKGSADGAPASPAAQPTEPRLLAEPGRPISPPHG